MKIASLKVFEGQNIKKVKRTIRVCLKDISDADVKKYLKAYFRVCFLLGYKERLVDLEKKDEWEIWVTYTEEEVSKYVLNNILYNLENPESITEKAENLVKEGFLYDVIKSSRKEGIPVIEISEDLFQLGYGKNSLCVGKNYQSYENMTEVEISRNRKTLWQKLRYAHIPKVDGRVLYSIEEIKEIAAYRFPINLRSIDKNMDVKVTISDEEELNRVLNNMMKMYTRSFVYSGSVKYRIICFKGEAGVILKKDNGYKVIEISERNLEVLEIIEVMDRLKSFCRKVYKEIPIEFMYIDLQEEEQLKVVDLGCVFDIGSELNIVKDKIISFFIESIKAQGIGLIPVIAVTGTNGKTTTTRLIYNILKGTGFNTAMTSTGGIFINGSKVKNGDTTGFLSAREVLSNKEVEVAVMETARGGVYRNGLGYEKAEAVVFTSIAEDHIGMENINNIKDLLHIKSVLFEELDEGGKIIVKAQELLVDLVKEKENVCLFEIDKNPLIENHINMGKEAFYLEDYNIVWCRNGRARKIVDVRNLEFAHFGYSKSNILNVMASLAAVFQVCTDVESVLSVLGSIKCDLYFNPGRQNILDFENYKVILDYGHNAEAFQEVLGIARSLKPSRLTAIIAAAGDRMDKYIRELGSISASYCDHIIIREQDILRGRKPGESAGLISQGVLETGFSKDNVEVIFKEEDAILRAMEKAEENEVIVLFTQCLDVIMPVINSYRKKLGKAPVAEELDFSH